MSKNKDGKKIPQLIDRDPLHPEKKLVTRRDFLSSGVIGMAGTMMIPSVFEVLAFSNSANAADCASSAANLNSIPFLVIDCAGGASLSGNWIMSATPGKTFNRLPSYSRLGLSSLETTVVDTQFGAPMAAPRPPVAPATTINATDLFSNIRQALDSLPVSIKSCLRMGVICNETLSDTGANLLSAVSLVSAVGASGNKINKALGNRQSRSGGNSDAADLIGAYSAMGVTSVDSLSNALSFGPAFSHLSTGVKNSLSKAVNRLNQSQATELSKKTLGTQFQELMGCSFDKFHSFAAEVGGGIDARSDTAVRSELLQGADAASFTGGVAGIYGLTGATGAGDPMAVEATIVKCAIGERPNATSSAPGPGLSGPGVITIGGCDYHDGTRTTGDGRDTQIGQTLARALRVAMLKNKPLAFQICTDGGISSDEGLRTWRGDDNGKGATIFGVFDPTGARTMVSHQIGNYTSGQGVERNHFAGADARHVAHTVLMNYLALIGQLDRYDAIVKVVSSRGNPAESNDLKKSLLLFPDSTGFLS